MVYGPTVKRSIKFLWEGLGAIWGLSGVVE